MIAPRLCRSGGSIARKSQLNLQIRALSVSSVARANLPRNTLSTIWIPTGGITAIDDETGHGKLIRGGFLRQAHSGIFQLLPLGLRVQDKIEKLLDKHMRSVARKYRDERRPRHGLLRSREFLMKDLYTFDGTTKAAIDTYHQVSRAYRAFFSELKLPYLVAEASSGDMGGDLSHEYHLPSAVGEDTVVNCDSCGYTANDEVASARPLSTTRHDGTSVSASQVRVWRGISKDRNVLINAWYPHSSETLAESGLNLHALKTAVPELDTTIDDPLPFWSNALEGGKPQVVNVVDARLSSVFEPLQSLLPLLPKNLESHQVEHSTVGVADSAAGLNLVRISDGDGCPRCEEGTLKIHRALECGHTFHLGTRYSEPLDASVLLPSSTPDATKNEGLEARVPLQMGCHGVGVSRIFGAVAEILADKRGLNWPRAIAPFEVVIIPTHKLEDKAREVYDSLAADNGSQPGLDLVLDDRDQSFGWKMNDADMIGYPIMVILGHAFKKTGACEVQCRRLSVKENVKIEELPGFISGLLDQL
ncbi:Prolyl-tRNA synthetase [Fusarium albosuccineum]|uniref:Prolyl-tRNA synthetase n=1 Tax=Fusarium albosuccineum TaxID=1237068 RepID=A0A8H4KKE8_9HYPO|nr:Prolyl-tRNA synthetase [Fusarium albosuccineum]